MARKTIRLPYKYEPWRYQIADMLAPLDQGINRIIGVWHRRSGKDKTAWNAAIKATQKRRGNYFYMFPTGTQGRKAIWDGIDNDGMSFLDHIPKEITKGFNNTEMKVTFTNGSTLQIVGNDNYNSVMGSNPVGIVFSEYSLMNPLAWEYIKPILKVNKGWAIFVYTPRGGNHGKRLYDMALMNPERWYASMLTVNDTNVLTDKDIAEERADGMSDEMIEQEYYCSFLGAVPGSYYGKLMATARQDGRIVAKLPMEPAISVDTYWDIGIGDSTAIWFVQTVSSREIRCIDYYEMSGEGLGHYISYLQAKALERKFCYGEHNVPHDFQAREFGAGLTREEQARKLGLKVNVIPRIAVDDGIEATRSILPKVWFDGARCEQGINALENYRKDWNEKDQVFRLKPVHDWASNGADAFRYMATGHRLSEIKRNIKNRSGGASYTTTDVLRGNTRGAERQPFRDPLQRRVG